MSKYNLYGLMAVIISDVCSMAYCNGTFGTYEHENEDGKIVVILLYENGVNILNKYVKIKIID